MSTSITFRSFITNLIDSSKIPHEIIETINANPDFENMDNHRVSVIQSYFHDNNLIEYYKWILNIIFYISTRVPICAGECCICLENIADNATVLLCKHCFHNDCIKSWKKERNVCPLCNVKIVYSTVSLRHNIHDGFDILMQNFDIIERESCKLNKRWFCTVIPAFNKYYLAYQLCKMTNIRLNNAEEQGLLDVIHLLSSEDLQCQDDNWMKICRSLKIERKNYCLIAYNS